MTIFYIYYSLLFHNIILKKKKEISGLLYSKYSINITLILLYYDIVI